MHAIAQLIPRLLIINDLQLHDFPCYVTLGHSVLALGLKFTMHTYLRILAAVFAKHDTLRKTWR